MLPEKLPGKVVSATAFVRNFGAYARTAGSEPIHILNHGRPAWSLISTDHLARLADARSGGPENGQDRLALSMVLDTISTQVIMMDADLRVIRINAAARHALKVEEEDIRSVPIGALMSNNRQQFVLRAIERVRDTGVSENFQVDSSSPPRTYAMKVERFAEGLVLFADETTAQTLIRERHDAANAYETLMDCLPGLARGAINVRSIISSASPALAELVQTDPGRIVGMRLASLFHTSSRTAVTDAIETLLDERKGFTMSAVLQGGGTKTTTVTLSASPNAIFGRDDGAIFLLQKSAT